MTVCDRRVFYFHGFDPASTARYRRIFAAASERLGVVVDDATEAEGWLALHGDTRTWFTYLRYDDLVREAQRGGLLSRLGRGLRTMMSMQFDGSFGRLPVRTMGLVAAPFAVAAGALVVAGNLAAELPGVGLALAASVLGVAWYLLLPMKLILASDLFAFMRSVARGDWAAEPYEARLPEFAAQIVPEGDEVLVVGHSLGGIAAIRAVAARLADWPDDRQISLLTLGSVHGIVLAQRGPGSDRLADAIAAIASDRRVVWVDVSNPRDAFCIPLTDPLLMIEDRAQPDMQSPLVISAPLSRAPRIPGDRRTLFGAMRRHMGYLLAAPEGAGFDYSDWVTGETTLAERTAGRSPSPRARMWQR
ncbi:MAG: hypothetical protein AAF409_09050 [Pseudomonadota bacterium]